MKLLGSTAKFAKKCFSSMYMPPNQFMADTSVTPGTCLILVS